MKQNFNSALAVVGLFVFLVFDLSVQARAQNQSYDDLRHDIVYNGKIATSRDPISYSTVKFLTYGRFFCSGTLIAPDMVLTAAHCAPNFRGVTVEVAGQERYVEDFRVHPFAKSKKSFFNLSEAIYFDIMVVYLREPIAAPGMPVALPSRGDRVSTNEELLLAGYGCINRIGTPDRGRLSYAFVKSAKYIKPSEGESLQMNTSGAACQGDSGGPVYGMRAKRLTVLGVTSWGDTLGFITRSEVVEAHLDWIERSMLELRAGTTL